MNRTLPKILNFHDFLKGAIVKDFQYFFQTERVSACMITDDRGIFSKETWNERVWF